MSVRRTAAAGALLGVLPSLLSAGPAAAAERPTPRAVLTARDEVFARPEYALRPDDEPSLLVELLEWLGEAVLEFSDRHPVAFVVLVGVLVLVLLVLVAHIVWTISVARRARYEEPLDEPVLDLRTADPREFRTAALRLADAGRFDAAVRELYTALLVALERRGDVSWARHKALLDYRLEARSDEAREALDLFAGGYHPTSFGRRPLPEERFRALLAALDGLLP